MKGYLVFLLAAFVAVQVAYATEVGYARLIGGTADPTIVGDVYFVTLNSSYTWVWVSVTGITQYTGNQHGIHVHQYGDVTDRTFTSAGTHYQGDGSPSHGCEDTDVRHEGDMGNWNVDASGNIAQEKTLDLLALSGIYSIIGKAVVLHNFTDNCVNTTSSAARLASGVIGVANLTNLPLAVWNVLADNTTNPAASGDNTITAAVAYVTPTSSSSSVRGVVTFQQLDGNTVLVQANISGLTTGQAYGFHIHTYGDLNSTDGLATGSHYNPFGATHGIPPNSSRHAGDMGNICTFSNGFAFYNFTFTDDLLSLDNTNNVLGRTVIVHSIRDDGGSVYGSRLGQGVIGIAAPTTAVTLPTGVNITAPLCPVTSTTTATSSATTDASTSATTASTSTSSASSVYAGVFALFLVIAILF